MRNFGQALVFAAVVGLGTGCGGGGGGGGGALTIAEQLRNCVNDGSTHIFAILQAKSIAEFLIRNPGLSDPLATVTPGTDPNSWEYDIDFDLDGNGTNETNVFGTYTFSADPTDGTELGDTAEFDFDFEGGAGLNGAGTLFFRFGSAGDFSVSGFGSFNAGDGCTFDFLIDENTPLTFGLAPIPTAQFLDTEVFGTIGCGADIGDNSISATLTINQGDNTVFATEVEIDDLPVGDFDFELPIDTDAYQVLRECALAHWEGSFTLMAALLEAVGSVANPESTFDEGELTLTPINLLTTEFEIVFNEMSNFDPGDTVTGVIAFSGIPAPNTTLTILISFDFVTANGLYKVSTPDGMPIQVVAQLADTAPEDPIDATSLLFSGRIECDLATDDIVLAQEAPRCLASLTVDAGAPIELFDYIDTGNTAAKLTVEALYSGHTLRYSVQQASSTEVSLRTFLDGIPIPLSNAELLTFFPFLD